MEYRLGSKEKKVGEIQTYLNRVRSEVLRSRDSKYQVSNDWVNLDIDNDFGILTERAVRGFQKMLGISENGIVGNTTWNHLSTISIGPSIDAVPVFRGIYKIGDKGSEVRKIQELLNKAWNALSTDVRTAYRWEYIAEDGVFGERTKCAVIAFQSYKNISPISGNVGDTTINYLRNFQVLCGKGLARTIISKTEIRASRSSLVEIFKTLLGSFIDTTGNFLEANLAKLSQTNMVENNVLENLNRRLRESAKLQDISMTTARRNLAKSCNYRQNVTHLNNTTFFRRINEFVSPISDSMRILGGNQVESWSNAQKNIFDAIRKYNVKKKIQACINKYTTNNQMTQANITKVGTLSKACSFVGFLLKWGEFVLLVATYEDTKEWNNKMEKCVYSLMDQLIADLVVAIIGLIIAALVALGIIAMPAGWIVALILTLVGLISAYFIWLLEDPEHDIYPSKYLQDAGYIATYKMLY